MEDEQFWYHDRWRALRGSIVRVALDEIDTLLAYCTLPHQVDEALKVARGYIESVTKELDRRRRAHAAARSGYGGPWAFARSLFGESEQLAGILMREQGPVCGRKDGVTSEQALGRALHLYLSEARRPLVSPSAPNRTRVWDMICEIDRSVSRNAPVGDPLEPDHLHQVMAAIDVRVKAGDRNLPRREETLVDYYREFDRRCRHQQLPEGDDVFLPADQIDVLRRQTELGPRLRHALLRLPIDIRPSFDHWLATEMGSTTKTEQDFCRDKGLSRRDYRRHVEQAKDFLRDALEDLL
jgi:hypothetical protein